MGFQPSETSKRSSMNTLDSSPYYSLWFSVTSMMRNMIHQLTFDFKGNSKGKQQKKLRKLLPSGLRSQNNMSIYEDVPNICSIWIEENVKEKDLYKEFLDGYKQRQLGDLKQKLGIVLNTWGCYVDNNHALKVGEIRQKWVDEGLQICFDFIDTYQRLLYVPLRFFYIGIRNEEKNGTLKKPLLEECCYVVRFFEALSVHSSQWQVVQPLIYKDIRIMMKGIASSISA